MEEETSDVETNQMWWGILEAFGLSGHSRMHMSSILLSYEEEMRQITVKATFGQERICSKMVQMVSLDPDSKIC